MLSEPQHVGAFGIGVAFAVRFLIVALFLPFSALDKIIDFRGAVHQAQKAAPSFRAAALLIMAGFCIEVTTSAAILTGIADRAAAFVLSGYCVLTALLWKQFWRYDDFWASGESKARDLFWDFWKNIALAGGLLLITFGTNAGSVEIFFRDPLSSTRPYLPASEVAP
jgi:putative oxidoreductase